MGDDQGGTLGEQFFDRKLDEAFGFAVDARSRFIHHKDARIVGEGASERDELTLARGEIGATFMDLVVNSLGQPLDEFQRLRARERLPDFALAEFDTCQANVIEDISGEEEDILLKQADCAPELLQIPFAHVDAVDEDAARGDVVEARQELDYRGLARPGRADDSDLLTGIDPEAQIPQHRLATPVLEAHMVERNSAGAVRDTAGHGWARDRGPRFHQRLDSFDRGERGLERRILARDVAQRREETLRIIDKGDERAKPDQVVHHFAAPDPDNDRDGNRAHRFDGRVKRAVVYVGGPLDVAALLVQIVKFPLALALAREELDDRHSAQCFGEVGVECGEAFADVAINHPNPHAEKIDEDQKRRNRA